MGGYHHGSSQNVKTKTQTTVFRFFFCWCARRRDEGSVNTRMRPYATAVRHHDPLPTAFRAEPGFRALTLAYPAGHSRLCRHSYRLA